MIFFAKIGIFCKSIAGPLSEAKTHWMVNWLQLLNQLNFVWRHTKVFMKNSSQWYLRNVLFWERRCASHTLSATEQYSSVYALFFAFHALVYRWGCQFLSLFSQDNEHTKLTVLFFFQNPYTIYAHIPQHYYDFQSKVAIFASIVQAYTQPYSFSGRIKLLICQIRYELSVIIHEISTMLVLLAWARPQPMKTLKKWRIWFWIIVESLLERLLMKLP